MSEIAENMPLVVKRGVMTPDAYDYSRRGEIKSPSATTKSHLALRDKQASAHYLELEKSN